MILSHAGYKNVLFTIGEYSGSTFHMSSSAEKEDIKDGIENCGVQVRNPKYFKLVWIGKMHIQVKRQICL